MSRPTRWLGRLYLLLFLAFMAAPLFFVVVNSFNDAAFSVFPPQGFSLRWYANLLAVEDFFIALRNSAIIAVSAMLLALCAGMAAALAIVRGRWGRPELVQSAMLSPLLMPRIVIGVAAFVAAVQVGLYPSLLSMVLTHAVLLLPYVVSLLVASFQQVNRTQEEAAMDLGAGRWSTFRLATLPQVLPGLAIAAIFSFIVSFDEFDISLFLARSENMTLPVRMFLFMQEQENPTLAAMSSVLLGLSCLCVAALVLIGRRTNLLALLSRRGP